MPEPETPGRGRFRGAVLFSAPLIGAERHKNPDPAPLTAPAAVKSIGHCNHCGFEVVWDQAGQAMMEEHYIKTHPEII